MGIEPTTLALEARCSTSELLPLMLTSAKHNIRMEYRNNPPIRLF